MGMVLCLMKKPKQWQIRSGFPKICLGIHNDNLFTGKSVFEERLAERGIPQGQ